MTGRRPPSPPPPAVTSKFRWDDRFIVMGVDFRVIWAADFNDVIRYYVRLPARRPRFTRRPPSHQNSEMTDIMLWASILGIFGSLFSIMPLDVMSADLAACLGPVISDLEFFKIYLRRF